MRTNVRVSVCTYVQLPTRVRAYMRTRAFTRVGTYVRARVRRYVRTYVRTRGRMYVRAYARMYAQKPQKVNTATGTVPTVPPWRLALSLSLCRSVLRTSSALQLQRIRWQLRAADGLHNTMPVTQKPCSSQRTSESQLQAKRRCRDVAFTASCSQGAGLPLKSGQP